MNATSNDRWTPLLLAAQAHAEVFKTLLERGANMEVGLVNGCAPLHVCSSADGQC